MNVQNLSQESSSSSCYEDAALFQYLSEPRDIWQGDTNATAITITTNNT